MQKLLVVEDNPVVREGLEVVLRREGYAVVHAGDGEEALHYLLTHSRPDLIVLDMLLPVLDGWHFLGRLKKEGPQPHVPVVITTAVSLTLQWALDHGCQGFLKKPIEADELLAEVRRCLPAS